MRYHFLFVSFFISTVCVQIICERDLVRAIVDSARKHGLKIFITVSITGTIQDIQTIKKKVVKNIIAGCTVISC